METRMDMKAGFVKNGCFPGTCKLTRGTNAFYVGDSSRSCGVGRLRRTRRRRAGGHRFRGALSDPFLIPPDIGGDSFLRPNPITFSPTGAGEVTRIFGVDLSVALSSKPEVAGSVLLAIAVYFGYSETKRWGTALEEFLASRVGGELATAFHALPFLLAGIALDWTIAKTLGSAWVYALGTTGVLWAGLYELGRRQALLSEEQKLVEAQAFEIFQEFAEHHLIRSGRCHFVDVAKRFRFYAPSPFRHPKSLTDQQLQKFISMYAPQALRSPNGFYKNLSVRRQNSERRNPSPKYPSSE
mmetsp:Transcript_3639/g.6923  ORF Transcript_3639/g.6923 Transcript_3639/m.6923 type:complete len:298 (-) Transcript_3639:312-1205(-)